MSKEKFLVLDVEGYSTCRPYNVGYIIADRYGKIYRKRSIALTECIWENIQDMVSSQQAVEMTKKNIEEILQDVGNKRLHRKYKIMGVNEFFKFFTKDVEKFKVKKMYAYNVTFDKNAMSRLFGERFTNFNFEFRDIITGILNTKLLTKKYLDFCDSHNFKTEKGNYLTKAEVVYRYLTGDLNFTEEHTGLQDVLIEYDILMSVFKSKKSTDWKPCQAWRKLKKMSEGE